MTETDHSEGIEGVPLASRETRERLTERQLVDYRQHRTEMIRWHLHLGKDPSQGRGYAQGTVRRRLALLDKWYRWVWDEEGGYTSHPTHQHADNYVLHLAYRDDISDAGRANYQKALKSYWRWRGDEWDPEITFTDASTSAQPRDYLTREERALLRDAALEYGSVPHYNHVTPEERRRWKRHLAQRFRKPADTITAEEFRRANGFKIPSLVFTSLDAGLRPVEVGRARVSWVDVDNAVLRIGSEDASKNDGNWTVSLSRRTAEMLANWLEERECYEKYDETDLIWLTRKSTPYSSRSLKYLLRRLCDEAGIDYENRTMTWYTIRHSVGTFMAREEGLAAAQAQLRHKRIQTTARYDHAPPEDRRDALDDMG